MKLTQQDIFEIITNLRLEIEKKGIFHPYPDFNSVCSAICKKLCIKEDEVLRNIASNQLKQFKLSSSKKGPRQASTDIVINSDDFASSRPNPPPKKRKSLELLTSRKQLSRRMEPIFNEIKQYANEENVEITRVLGLLLTLCGSKAVSDIGERLWNDKLSDDTKVPVVTSLAIYNDCNLGRQTYTKQRKILSATGFKILPSWRMLREQQELITPNMNDLPDPYVGVYYKLKDAVKITVSRILELECIKLHEIPGNIIKSSIKFGFDGSGSHNIFNQSNNENTNNIIMSAFCPLKLQNGD